MALFAFRGSRDVSRAVHVYCLLWCVRLDLSSLREVHRGDSRAVITL
jgi:hypothetical protein